LPLRPPARPADQHRRARLAWVAGFVVPGRRRRRRTPGSGPDRRSRRPSRARGERGGRAGVPPGGHRRRGRVLRSRPHAANASSLDQRPVAKQTSRKRLTKIKVNITKPK
jgi:hypothetical protein